MKPKTIRKVLKAKVESLATYVEEYTSERPDKLSPRSEAASPLYDDPTLGKAIRENSILTGGCIVSMLFKENPNDYDLYFRTRTTTMRVTKFFMWLFAHQNGNDQATFIEYKQGGEEELQKKALTENVGMSKDMIYDNGWRRHHPTRENATETPGKGRFRVVIKSAGIASTQDSNVEYAYFEQQDDEAGSGYVEGITQADEVGAELLEDIKEREDKGKHHPKFMSSNAITLAGKIQIITRFWGEPGEIHENYDFVHCTCVYSSWVNTLELPRAALESMLTKELKYQGSLYPLCSIIRIRKFVARGWTINAGQVLKMCFQLSDLDLRDVEVLEDQLTGVDAAYFQQIISRLREKNAKELADFKEKNPSLTPEEIKEQTNQSIDSTYLMTIIDRIF